MTKENEMYDFSWTNNDSNSINSGNINRECRLFYLKIFCLFSKISYRHVIDQFDYAQYWYVYLMLSYPSFHFLFLFEQHLSPQQVIIYSSSYRLILLTENSNQLFQCWTWFTCTSNWHNTDDMDIVYILFYGQSIDIHFALWLCNRWNESFLSR